MKTLLKQALDALTKAEDCLSNFDTDYARTTATGCDEAIEALRAAIAQPENEPVAWMDNDGNISDNNDHNCFSIPLYTHTAQPYVPLTQAQVEAFAHRRATKYTHRSDSTYHSYAFVPHTLMDFVGDIEKALRGAL